MLGLLLSLSFHSFIDRMNPMRRSSLTNLHFMASSRKKGKTSKHVLRPKRYHESRSSLVCDKRDCVCYNFAKEWSKLVTFAHQAILDPADSLREVNIWSVKSINEQLLVKLIDNGRAEVLVRLCQRQLVRCYPGGNRADSDNLDPSLAWSLGCNFAALNYQTHDLPFQRMFAYFTPAVGFRLRPDFLNDPMVEFAPSWTAQEVLSRPTQVVSAPRGATITIVSGQQLRFPSTGERGHDEIIDPYVHCQVVPLAFLVVVDVHTDSWAT